MIRTISGRIGPGALRGRSGLMEVRAIGGPHIVAEPGQQIVKLDPQAVGELLDRSPTPAAEPLDAWRRGYDPGTAFAGHG